MKTICPHCYQDYDVTEDFLNQEVNCTVCKKAFTVRKMKLCSECGTPNPAQALMCRQCKHDFPITLAPFPRQTSTEQSFSPVPQSPSSGNTKCPAKKKYSILDGMSKFQKREIRILGSFASILGILGGIAVTVNAFLAFEFCANIWITSLELIFGLFIILFFIDVWRMMKEAVNPKAEPLRCGNICLWINLIFCFILDIIFCWNLIMNGRAPIIFKVIFVTLAIYFFKTYITAFNIHRMRLAEEEIFSHPEENKEDECPNQPFDNR